MARAAIGSPWASTRSWAMLGHPYAHRRRWARAAGWHTQAARQALDASDVQAATSRAARGEACGAEGVDLGRLRVVQAEVHGWRGDAPRASALLRVALSLLPEGSVEWVMAAHAAAREAGRAGDIDRVLEIASRLEALPDDDETRSHRVIGLASAAKRLHMAGHFARADALRELIEQLTTRVPSGDAAVAGQLANLRVTWARAAGEIEAVVEHAEAAALAFEQAGDMRNMCAQRSDAADGHMTLGRWERAESLLRQVLPVCDRTGMVAIAPGVRGNLAYVLARRGRTGEALTLVKEAMAEVRRSTNPHVEGGIGVYHATLLALVGDVDAAALEARRAHRMLEVSPALQPFALATLARIELQRGRAADALAAAEQAVTQMDSLAAVEGEGLARLVHAEALRACGRVEDAKRALASARAPLLRQADRLILPATRESFLAIEEHARTLALAKEWDEPSVAT